MAARVTRGARPAPGTGRRIANSRYVSMLARAGFVARGVMYILIGCLAIGIAFGNSGHRADQSGAVRLIGHTPLGEVALWLLVIGFAGMALWRLSEAIYGGPGPGGRKTSTRLAALGRVVIYGFITFVVLKYALGLGAPPSSNKTSRDLTAKLMHQPAGRIVVGLIGIALLAAGIALAFQAWQRKFLRNMRTGEMSYRVRRVVEFLGTAGGIARGTVFAGAGVFLLVAAVNAKPGQAKGIDATLRALTRTPAGPWLLLVVAIGLVTFGVFSCTEARWRRV